MSTETRTEYEITDEELFAIMNNARRMRAQAMRQATRGMVEGVRDFFRGFAASTRAAR